VKPELSRVLGHPARIRIPELLRDGERSAGPPQAEPGPDSGGASQHRAAPRRAGLAESRREGTTVLCPAGDARVPGLLAAGRDIITRRLAGQQSILCELGRS
jgi:ArsR family transcriptional regulator